MNIMKMRITKSQLGYTLLEFLIAAFIGLIVMAAITSMFRMAMNAMFTVTQRAEAQQDMRAGIELMTKDISMAGAGLPSGGLQLPTGSTIKIACNQSSTCYVPSDTYPNTNYMTGIIPAYDKGVEGGATITSAPSAVNDAITTIYCDYNFPLTNFNFTLVGGPPAVATATLVATPDTSLPTNPVAAGGLNVGDLMLFIVTASGTGTASGDQGTSAGQTAAAVGEVTSLPASSSSGPWSISFAAADPLNFNQTGANSLAAAGTASDAAASASSTAPTMTVCRLEAVTYFLEVPAAGGTVQTPRLMRQVNGLTAVPVADNIINLQFSYDVINSQTGTISANQSNPLASGLSLALIQKVDLWLMGQGLVSGNNKSQSMYLATSVSAGNMSFCNSYSDSTTVCQ
jgi:Prokaryotic N-terminal methylation motif